MRKLECTSWKDGEFFLAHLNEYPDYQTQAYSKGELKRRDFVRRLEEMRCKLVRPGGNNQFCTNCKTGQSQPVPSHSEINERLAKSIIRKLSQDK